MAITTDMGLPHTVTALPSSPDAITVPDANLLFKGDFSRSGHDLVLKGADGAKVVIEGYFSTENPPALVSPEGAMLTGDAVTSLAGPLFPAQFAQIGNASTGDVPIGQVQTIEGSASVVRANGLTLQLKVGDPVFQGDVVLTGPGSKLGVSFIDGTVFSLSDDARMVLDSLIFDPNGSNNSMLLTLVEGTFVFASGDIAPNGDMKIQTPVATMGIRGTAPTVSINSLTGQVKFSIVPDPGDEHVGTYTLYSLVTGDAIGTVSSVGSSWQLTSADGSLTEIPKSEDDILNDINAISEITNVFTTTQSNNQQQQQQQQGEAGDTTNSIPNTPPSSGLNTGETGPDGSTTPPPPDAPPPPPEGDPAPTETAPPPTGTTENNEPPPPAPPGGGEEPPVTAGPDVIDGDDNPNVLIGTASDEIINGFGGIDFINAGAGDDIVNAGDGDDNIIGGSGEGDDTYNGGEGTDTLFYTSTTQGIEIDLANGTVTGPEIGNDTFTSVEKFVGGTGDDTFIVDQDGDWSFDGGAGTNTIQIVGDLDIDTSTFAGIAENIEIIDLNKTDANSFTIRVDDFLTPGTSNTLQFRGGASDTLNISSEPLSDGNGGFVEGAWHQLQTVKMIDGLEFDVFEFVDAQGVVYATAEVEQGIVVEAPVGGKFSESFENGFGANSWSVINATISTTNSIEGNSSARMSTGSITGAGPQNATAIAALAGITVATLNALANDSAGAGSVTEGGAIATNFTGLAGQVISFDWFFSTLEYPNFNDVAFVAIDGKAVKLFDVESSGNQSGSTTTEGWNTFSMVLTESGDHTIAFGVLDDSDGAVATDLNIDKIRLGPIGEQVHLGGDGNDTIIGGNGNDIISGGPGNDTLTGGPGADTFIFANINDGIDTITDFDAAQDLLDFSGLLDLVFNPLTDNISEFVTATTDALTGETTVAVDADGAGGPAGFTPVALLQGVGAGVDIAVSIGDDDNTVTSAIV